MSTIIKEYLIKSAAALNQLLVEIAAIGVDTTPINGRYWADDFQDYAYLQVWDNETISITKERCVENSNRHIDYQFIVYAHSGLSKGSSILDEAQNLIYGDRQADYGSVITNFTNIAKGWSVILGTEVTPEQVGLAMAWVKIARQANRRKRDNLVDIAGYIGCIEKMEKGE